MASTPGCSTRTVRGEGIEPSRAASKTAGLPLANPRECPVGIEPTLLVWKTRASPIGQGHKRRKGRESNPQGSSLGRFRDGCHRQLACPSVHYHYRSLMKRDSSKLIMRKNSPRYGTVCEHCRLRIRVGKTFVIDPENSKKVFHEVCFHLHKR